jgi:glyoxylase-like metal-dependent hydrolase (beta-lactamase superfamily II)
VIFSHLHFDHIGGVIDKSPTGAIRPIFTNARFYIQRREWDLALAPTDERLAAAYRHAPECLRALEKVTLVDGDSEIVSCVRTAISGGHTDLHQCVIVEAEGTGLIHLADIVPTTSHLRLAWNAAYDTNPLATIAAKKRFFAEARARNLWVSFSHDDKVAAGLLDKEEGKTPLLLETISL